MMMMMMIVMIMMMMMIMIVIRIVSDGIVTVNVMQFLLRILSEVVSSARQSLVSDKDRVKIKLLVQRIVMLSNASKSIITACDTSFLYYHTDILSFIIKSIYSQSTEANRLQYLLNAFNDGIRQCQYVLHMDATSFVVNYRDILRHAIATEVIQPLCHDIETDLRLHIHTKHLDHMQTVNPKTEKMIRPLRQFLDLSPLRIVGQLLDIHAEVWYGIDISQ
jgi:WASH complex subunit 7